MWKQIGPYLPALVVVGWILWRQRSGRASKLRLRAMWISPVLVALATFAVFHQTLPPVTFAVLAGFPVAAALGLVLGWLRARHMEMAVDPDLGTVTTRATPIGTLLVIGLIILRIGLKLAFPELAVSSHGHPVGVALMWTDAGLLFSCGLVWARAVTLYLRARPLLEAHRAAAE